MNRTSGRTPSNRGIRPGARLLRRPKPLPVFMSLITATGLPLTIWAMVALTTVHWDYDLPILVFLGLGLVIGELLPIEVARQGRHSDEITISSTFSLALVLMAPLGVVLIAQAIPLVIDDVRRGKHWSRPVFNVAQYTLTLAAARLAFCLVSHQEFLHPGPFGAADIPAAFTAALVYFTVNHGLVGTAVALWSDEPILRHLREDMRFQLITSGLLLALAPVVLSVSDFSIALVPVLMLPIAAVRNTARVAMQRHSDALHDALTGLPNRALLLLELNRAVADVERRDDRFAVLFIDLDHFKEVNDTLGHATGDLLIVEVAARLAQAAGPDVTVARLGGDEFAVIARLSRGGSQTARDEAVELAERLGGSLDEAVSLAGVRLEVRASIGIALAPEHTVNSDDLLAKADIAMYLAKGNDGGWAVYDPQLDQNTPERLMLLTELRDGLDAGELVVHYQPKCDVGTGAVNGVEALVRWQHPLRGLLQPNDFVPLAETTELIARMTFVVLEQSIRQAARWRAQGRPLGIAVNLSVRHLADQKLPAKVHEILSRHGLPAELLTLEVTESTVMNDPHRAAAVLASLRAYGIKIAVDDYGTGYSSLTYLKRLAVDELKIDRSFISAMTKDPNDQIIVKSTIDLGHNLGLRVVAEGVEDFDTWATLQALGCDVIQGYVINRPQPADVFDRWLERWELDDHGRRTEPSRVVLPAAAEIGHTSC